MSSATLRQNVQSVPAARNQQRQEPAVNGTVPQVKPVVARGVRGHVKWFNVKRGYGFVNRDDNHEDIFIHQTSIARNNPHKYLRSVGDNEPLVFDVVQGEKGLEASNVTGPNGSPVQGSRYAADRPQREFRQRRGQLYGFYRARAAGNGPVVVQPMMTTAAQNLVMGAAPMMSPAAAAAAYIYQQLYGPTIQNQPAPIPAYFVNGQIHPAEMMAPPPPQQPTTNFVSPTSTGTMSSPNNQTSPDLASNDDSPTTPETPRPNLHQQQQQPMFPLPTTPAYQPNQSVYYTPPSRSINNQRTNGGGYHTTTTTTNYAMPPPANPNTFYAGGAWRGRGRRGRRRYYRTPRGGGGRAPPAQIVQ